MEKQAADQPVALSHCQVSVNEDFEFSKNLNQRFADKDHLSGLYKEQADGRRALTVITVAEWRRITADNKAKPIQARRYFVSDGI